MDLEDHIPEEPPPGDPDSIRLDIQMPSGEWLRRSFLRSHSLKYLYSYICRQEGAPTNFEVFRDFPRQLLPCQSTLKCPEPPSFDDLELQDTEEAPSRNHRTMDSREISSTQSPRMHRDEETRASLHSLQRRKRLLREFQQKLAARKRQQMEEQEGEENLHEMELEDHIPDEPSPGDPDSIRLDIEMPSGTWLRRRFLRSQSLKYLYSYICRQEGAPTNFEVYRDFPRQLLPCQSTLQCPEPPSFDDLELHDKEEVIVIKLYDW
ncbi:hypothetical protein HPB50_029433 [Hyalomma asiaticum]|nr:hypothetical protein HPB50_029433 [Hyalomma asiaticum]